MNRSRGLNGFRSAAAAHNTKSANASPAKVATKTGSNTVQLLTTPAILASLQSVCFKITSRYVSSMLLGVARVIAKLCRIAAAGRPVHMVPSVHGLSGVVVLWFARFERDVPVARTSL